MTPVSDTDYNFTVSVCSCSHGNRAADPGNNTWHREAGAWRLVGALGGTAPVFKGSRAVIITANNVESRFALT